MGQFRSLTSKAYVNAFDDVQTFRIIDSQWESSDPASYEYKSFAFTGDGKASYTGVGCSFTCAYQGDIPLEYTLEIFDYYNNRIYICPIYAEMGERVEFGLPKVEATTDITYRIHLYVRRKDGGIMYKSSMYAASFSMYYIREEDVSDNTLPSDWFVDTTAAIETPSETYTTVIGTDIPWSEIQQQMTLPVAVENAALYIFDLISQLLVMRYLTFMIVFGLSCALICWILH